MSACGKGSYGRLGLGDSNNQATPKKIAIDGKVKKISSSKGSDGHTLALTDTGLVYSWGDGDYGKLGLGTCHAQKTPKLISGTLMGKTVKWIHAGHRHSAAVTDTGELYTWGVGDFGRLGHGDSNSRHLPTKVEDLSNVGSVASGTAHTLVLSADGKNVWSFGLGDNGQLGHGIATRIFRPKVIEALKGMYIHKIAAGGYFSMALTTCGQLYTWGNGCCLGCGEADATFLSPTLVQELSSHRIVDIAVGDIHCLALTLECEVYAWGNNITGQCGQGHLTAVLKPRKVLGLEGFPIHQISAGTSHSVAWTAFPVEQQLVIWHRPFCIDLHEDTFGLLRVFLEKYGDNFYGETPPKPFATEADHHKFIHLCTKLLYTHLSLSLTGGLTSSMLGKEASLLRHILFR